YTSLTYLSILFIPTSTPYIYTLSLHDALPISCALVRYNLAFWRRVNMKTSLSFAFLTLALVGSIQLEAQAQENQLQITQDKQYKDRKSTRLNSSHVSISYAVFCLKKKKKIEII